MAEDTIHRYMRLVDELERTAKEFNAPSEMVGDLAALAAVYFDREHGRRERVN